MNKPAPLKTPEEGRSISVLEETILNLTLPKLGSRKEGEDISDQREKSFGCEVLQR